MEAVRERTEAADVKQFIGFTVGEEHYGLELLRVKEVIRIRQITWLPKAPTFVKGIINLRGDLIPIVDLRDKFGLAARDYIATTRVIVVEVDAKIMGLVVDSASQVIRIPAADIDPPPPVLGGGAQEYISGVGKRDEELVVLLNVDSILSQEEKLQLGSMETKIDEGQDSTELVSERGKA
jgi:purine-binding chemotaxis protein CheW